MDNIYYISVGDFPGIKEFLASLKETEATFIRNSPTVQINYGFF